MKKLIFALILACNCPLSAAYQENAGTAGMQFLKIGAGARPAGMGEAFVSISDDANALYWNPAGLASSMNTEVMLSHNKWLSDIDFQSVSCILPVNKLFFNNRESLGFSVLYLHMGGIDGYDIDRFGNPLRINSFSVNDISVTGAYSVKISRNFFTGANIKFVQEKLAFFETNAYAFDFGLMFRKDFGGDVFKSGFCAQNIGTDIRYLSEISPLPKNFKLGASYQAFNRRLLVGVEADKPADNAYQYAGGLEFYLHQALAVRMGYNTKYSNVSGYSLGIGINISGINLDYAFIPYDIMGDMHRISINAKFSSGGFNTRPAQDYGDSGEAVEDIVREKQKLLDERNKLSDERKKIRKIRQEIVKRLKQYPEISIYEEDERYVVVIEGIVFGFELGSYGINPSKYKQMREIALFIRSMPNAKVDILGHADDGANPEYNYMLSVKRATSIRDYFVSEEKMPEGIFTTAGYGSTKLLVNNDNVEERLKNRRVEILIRSD